MARIAITYSCSFILAVAAWMIWIGLDRRDPVVVIAAGLAGGVMLACLVALFRDDGEQS